jgi:hypothetical protein
MFGDKGEHMNEYQRTVSGDRRSDWGLRRYLVTKFAWAIPNEKAIEVISKYSPIVEIGCGTGYWASLIEQAGATIMPFDKYRDNNPYKHQRQWTDVYAGDHEVLDKFHRKANLFLCWPPYDEPMAYQCVVNFKGEFILYVGEHVGGCTGEDRFFNELRKNWKMVTYVDIPRWEGVYDDLTIYKRK